jgi:uncharacterized peroxidase-related enzyme
MRLAILDHGHTFGTRLFFAFVAALSRRPVPEMLKLVKYRPAFFGQPMSALTHQAMRGPSAWTVGDRELMAASIAQANACDYCLKAHGAVAARAFNDEAKVRAVLGDVDTAPIAPPLRATLRMLRTLAREQTVSADDMRAVLDAGVSRQQIEDALAVSFAFNAINRLAEAFQFTVPDDKAFAASAGFLLRRGYR